MGRMRRLPDGDERNSACQADRLPGGFLARISLSGGGKRLEWELECIICLHMKAKAILFIVSFLLFIFVSCLHAAQTETNDYSWDLGVIDQLLSTVQPGQKLVQVGDMWIQVSYLQAWRNQLAGGAQANLAFNN